MKSERVCLCVCARVCVILLVSISIDRLDGP